jgi:hypothetical protein
MNSIEQIQCNLSNYGQRVGANWRKRREKQHLYLFRIVFWRSPASPADGREDFVNLGGDLHTDAFELLRRGARCYFSRMVLDRIHSFHC